VTFGDFYVMFQRGNHFINKRQTKTFKFEKSIVSIKQTEIDTIHSLENFMQNLLLPTETVIVAHPVKRT
jgi:hypothetical protein